MDADPLADGSIDAGRHPFDANGAIPSLLFGRYRKQLAEAFPRLEILGIERLSYIAYPLSGGFRPWSLMPAAIVDRVLWLEDRLSPLLGPLMAFRLLVTIQRTQH
jgi:hypothetical protein